MAYVLAADLVAIFHGGFVVFVALGGLVVWRFPRLLWLHLPALAWAIWIVTGNVCPLTTIENRLRAAAGVPGYQGGFIEHYITPLFAFAGLTSGGQYWLNVCLLTLNVGGYAVLLSRRTRQTKSAHRGDSPRPEP